MLIAQLSDLHYRLEGDRLFGQVDPHRALAAAIEHVRGLNPQPDVVILSGDLVNDGEAGEYAGLARMLRRLPMPVYAVPGNHDQRELTREHLAFTGVMPADGPLRFVVDDYPVRLICLDSLAEGVHSGRLGAEQIDWLNCELAAAPDRPTAIFLHHPPFRTGIGFMDEIMLEDAPALAEVVARHPQVGLVAAGHVHRVIQTRFAGTLAVTAPATSHQVVLALSPDIPVAWVGEPAGCLLHLWTQDAGIVSHLSPIGDFGGPQSFG